MPSGTLANHLGDPLKGLSMTSGNHRLPLTRRFTKTQLKVVERCASRAMTSAAIFECEIDIFKTNLKFKLCEAKNWSEKIGRYFKPL